MHQPNKQKKPTRIMGIDPGSRVCGFACIETKKPRPTKPSDFKIITAGVVRLDQISDHYERMGHLFRTISNLLEEINPSVCMLEKAFCGINISSALKLGEARGSLMAAIAARAVALQQITPAQVKKTIAGNGRATKEEISIALKAHLGFVRGNLPYDASDALAIALCGGLEFSFDRQMEFQAYGKPLSGAEVSSSS